MASREGAFYHNAAVVSHQTCSPLESRRGLVKPAVDKSKISQSGMIFVLAGFKSCVHEWLDGAWR